MAATLKPVVTLAEFEAIECNQCGDCCEEFNTRLSPFQMAARADQLEKWIYWRPLYTEAEKRSAMAQCRWEREAPILLESLPSSDRTRPWTYRCRFFERDDPDRGHCMVYAGRPPMCSKFPYDKPANFDRCAWNVEIELLVGDGWR